MYNDDYIYENGLTSGSRLNELTKIIHQVVSSQITTVLIAIPGQISIIPSSPK